MIDYSDLESILGRLDRNLLMLLAAVAGGVVMTAVWRKMWWLLALVLLLPTALYMTFALMPTAGNVTYQYFFPGVIGLAVCGLTYWLYKAF